MFNLAAVGRKVAQETEAVLHLFDHEHLSKAAQIAEHMAAVAASVASYLPDGPELRAGLRLLNQANTAFHAAVQVEQAAAMADVPAATMEHAANDGVAVDQAIASEEDAAANATAQPAQDAEEAPEQTSGTSESDTTPEEPEQAPETDAAPTADSAAPAAPALIPGRDHPITMDPAALAAV